VATFDAIGAGDWFRYLTGILEVAGALGLLIPRLAGLAALALAGLWLVAIAIHLFLIGGSAVAPIVFFVLTVVIAWGRRDRTLELLTAARRSPLR
jgi:putative oxidoreductase